MQTRKRLLETRNILVDVFKSAEFQYLSLFLAAALLRALPELLVPSYPVGYETITWYAPIMMNIKNQTLTEVFQGTFAGGPLFYVLMWLAVTATDVHPFVILKVVAPLLFGGLAVSFFHFLRRGMEFDGKAALVGGIFMIFQIAALRESWDRFRTVLALIFLFVTLASLRANRKNRWILVAVLSILTVLSRDYVSIVLFSVVVGFAVLERKGFLASVVAIAPPFALLAFMVSGGRLWWNYVGGGAPTFHSETYFGVMFDIVLIFSVCFLPILPFVLKGFRRNRLLDPMVIWLLIGSFSAVLIPWFAVPGYQRWLVLLVFPFTIYAVFGLERLGLLSAGKFKPLVAIMLIFMLLGTGYASGAFSYVVLPSSWVPPSLEKSSIEWSQVSEVRQVLLWLDQSAPTDSAFLTEERFYGWTLIYLRRANDDIEVVPYGGGAQPAYALEQALDKGFSWIYLIWYTESSFDKFNRVFSQGSISAFKYEVTGG